MVNFSYFLFNVSEHIHVILAYALTSTVSES